MQRLNTMDLILDQNTFFFSYSGYSYDNGNFFKCPDYDNYTHIRQILLLRK